MYLEEVGGGEGVQGKKTPSLKWVGPTEVFFETINQWTTKGWLLYNDGDNHTQIARVLYRFIRFLSRKGKGWLSEATVVNYLKKAKEAEKEREEEKRTFYHK